MIHKCPPCSFWASIDVDYTIGENDVTLVVSDPCCRVTDCKMIRAVIGAALYEMENDEDFSFPSAASGSCNPCCGGLGGIPSYPLVDWSFGTKTGVLDLAGVTGPAAEGTVSVSPPFCDVV